MQADLITDMDREQAADVIERMPPDEAADVIADLSREKAQELLGLIEREEAEAKELETEIVKSLKPLQVEIYQMLKKGYTQREIASGLDHGTVSQPYVNKQIKKIKEVVIKILRRREYI